MVNTGGEKAWIQGKNNFHVSCHGSSVAVNSFYELF